MARVYEQINAESSSIGPAVRMTSPAPEILAAGWSLTREAQLVGTAPVLDKTLVALGVSQANRCNYDTLAWLGALRLLGRPDLADVIDRGEPLADPRLAALLDWARSTATPGAPATLPGEPVAEYFGTALLSHFINRMVLAMLPADLTPGTLNPDDAPAFEGAPVFRRWQTDRAPGASLALLAGLPEGQLPEWADGAPAGRAYATLAAVARQGAGLLTPAARDVVSSVISAHRSRHTTDSDQLDEPLSTLPEQEQTGARVAILAGLAPDALTDGQVAAWRATDRRYSDHCTVHLLAYGAMTAVSHIETDLVETYTTGAKNA
ncbi:DNA-binding protein [Micromonospora citrea]|uniref:DNA-binding protein n=1 Tax=Micromonospora citrea TaxID=47855 RepID=UPI00114CF0DA|nr:DNA-binding protein [Micromonospora citrea]